ncbi:MAG: TIGR03088 family PEP-CTERM/XrtA system glycosyltransferase [Gammaproteobacteria bacterium]
MSEPIHIAHIIYRLAIGGMENGVVNLVNRMDSRFVHHIISLTDATEFQQRITNPDVRISTLNKKPGKDLGSYWRLWKLLRSRPVDIVHTRNFGTVDCGLIARLAGVKTLVHSEHGWDMSDLSGGNPKYIRLRRWLAPLATRWMAVSANIRDWLEHTVGVRADKLEHIYNGVDAERFQPATDSRSDALRAGFVGRLEDVKNPQSMLRAMARLSDDQSLLRTVELTVIGSGSLLEPLQEQARKAGLENSVRFLGPRKDVPELMQSFNVFVLSSYNEGISNTILEAMATGLPVIATDVGGNPELIVANKTGMLFSSDDDQALADCLKSYANDEQKRAAHGLAARQRIDERFTIAKMVEAYERFYLQSLKPKYGT